MIRESLNANSRQALVAVTPSNGVSMQYRTSTGGSSTNITGPVATAPEWVKLTRVGNVLTGFASADGVTWTQVGSVTITMASSVLVGLEADANTTSLLNTATFDNVTISQSGVPTVATPASASPSTVTGTTTSLSVLGADDQGEAGLTYTWSTTSKPVGAANPTLSANGTNAAKATTATFTQAGAYSFTVTITDANNLSTTSSVNVTVNQTLAAISLSPSSVTLNGGSTQQFTATGSDQFGAVLSVQPSITWSVSAGSGSVTTNGLYTAGNAAGSATVTATSSSFSASSNVTINNAAPTVATAAASSANPVTTTSTILSVLGADDRSESSLLYSWSVTSKPVGAADPTFSANGTNAAKTTTATFSQVGDYSFLVTITDLGGLTTTSSVSLTVSPTLTSLALSPSSVTLNGGATQQFSATAKDQFGAVLASQPSVTWSIASGTGTIDAAGLYIAGNSAGSATVQATFGAITGTASVTINNPAPTVATAAASSANPVTGTTTSLSVLGADDRGESTLTYSWSTTTKPSGATNPTFSASGTNAAKSVIATFSQAGSYTFAVTITDLGGATTTSSVSVTVNQTLTAISVSPSTASVNAGATQQLTASGTDQFGRALTTQHAFTWSVTSGGGTVTSTGLFTAPTTAGTSVVRATSGSIFGSSSLTIVAATVPVGPTSLTGTKSGKKAVLNWTDNATNETGFYVQYSTNGGSTWTTLATLAAKTGTGAMSYTTSNLANGTYSFRIVAFNAGGSSTPSNTVSVKI